MHEGTVSSRLGIGGLPAVAEEVVVARDLSLVRLTGARYHVQHVSSHSTIPLIRQAKEAGLPVTAEVTPHHLMFDHEQVLSLDPAFKMYPPLRTSSDIDALREALASGLIDAVATDHAPHASFETEVTFEEAPRGVIGLETAAAAVNLAVDLSPEDFFARLSTTPAQIGGLERHGQPLAEGSIANLVIFDPDARWTPSRFVSKSQNSPFRGTELRGRVLATIFEGRISHQTQLLEQRI